MKLNKSWRYKSWKLGHKGKTLIWNVKSWNIMQFNVPLQNFSWLNLDLIWCYSVYWVSYIILKWWFAFKTLFQKFISSNTHVKFTFSWFLTIWCSPSFCLVNVNWACNSFDVLLFALKYFMLFKFDFHWCLCQQTIWYAIAF